MLFRFDASLVEAFELVWYSYMEQSFGDMESFKDVEGLFTLYILHLHEACRFSLAVFNLVRRGLGFHKSIL